MNKLSPEHIHLLLDEPIYVLSNEHLPQHPEIPEHGTALQEEHETLVNFKGKNLKGILIIIEEQVEEALNIDDEEFLFKGLNALKIFADDVAIFAKLPDKMLPDTISFEKCITFSSEASSENLYQVETVDKIRYLNCQRLSNIRNDEALKRSFWHGLKALFEY